MREVRVINAVAITLARTDEEKLRRHLYGDGGNSYIRGKYMVLSDGVMGCVTTSATKDNLTAMIYET